jgi:hypothetical protein
MHVDDLADACHFLLDHYDDERPINVGIGEDFSIAELAECVAKVVGYHGKVCGDSNKPDGTPRKLLDVQTLTDLGWQAKIALVEGVRSTYEWFLEHQGDYRGPIRVRPMAAAAWPKRKRLGESVERVDASLRWLTPACRRAYVGAAYPWSVGKCRGPFSRSPSLG